MGGGWLKIDTVDDYKKSFDDQGRLILPAPRQRRGGSGRVIAGVGIVNPGTKHILLSRTPVKQIWDLLALAQVLVRGNVSTETRLSIRQKARCVRFYFEPNGIRRLWVNTPRSGGRWSQLALTLALNLAAGGDGEYVYENDIFYPSRGHICQRLDWRVPTGEWETQHARKSGPVLGDQKFFVFHNPYFRLRILPVREMKTVLVTRSILAILASRFYKFSQAKSRPSVSLDDQDSFDWDASLDCIIGFYNSWGDVMRWHPNVRHYKYEDMMADLVGTHMEVLDFWGLKVPEDCMAEGLRRSSKTEMLKHMPPQERERNLRVSTRSSEERKVISEARLRYIVDRLNRELIHDFGYAYDYDTPYNTAYD